MKMFLILISLVFGFSAAAEQIKPSGRAKAFKGPEGEVVTLIPIDGNKRAVVFAQDTYGVMTNKAVIYDFEDTVLNPKVLIPADKNELSKGRTSIMYSDKWQWTYSDLVGTESKEYRHIPLTYSEELSKKINTQKILKMAKIFEP